MFLLHDGSQIRMFEVELDLRYDITRVSREVKCSDKAYNYFLIPQPKICWRFLKGSFKYPLHVLTLSC